VNTAWRRPSQIAPSAVDAELLVEAAHADVLRPGRRVGAGAGGDLVQPSGDGDPRHRGDRAAQVVPTGQPDPDAVERPVDDDLSPHASPSPAITGGDCGESDTTRSEVQTVQWRRK